MVLSFGVDIPFVSHLGFTLHKIENGESELHYTAASEHHNSFEMTHGGALMTLMDVTMAVAARSVELEMGAITIEMKTSFMQPARGPLVARGKLLHRTRSMAFTEGEVFDAEGHLCCKASGTFRYMPRSPDKQNGPLPGTPLRTMTTG